MTALSELERELLASWTVRRLAFVAHAGAAGLTTTQTYSRLEHSLGLLALVVHFDPGDEVSRVAALLHDVGHLPLSHSFEGVAGLQHHALGVDRIRALSTVLQRHGCPIDAVLATLDGSRTSVLSGDTGGLKLDHLESLVRSAATHGRTEEPAPDTLRRLSLHKGAVSADPATAQYLTRLVVAEARSHLAPANVVPTAIVRDLAGRLLGSASADERARIAQLTDNEFWGALAADPRTAVVARELRRSPTSWVVDSSTSETSDGDLVHTVERLYLDLPLIDGVPAPRPSAIGDLPATPWRCVVRRRQ